MNIADIIMEIESGGNHKAIRFEPEFYKKLASNDTTVHKIKKLHECSIDTAKMIASTSFGLFQIMGYNLYLYDLIKIDIFDYIADRILQLQSFYKFIEIKDIDFSIRELVENDAYIEEFAKKYNGDVIHYSKKIRKILKREGLL